MQNRRLFIAPIVATVTLTTTLLDPTITSTAGSAGLGTIPQPYVLIRHVRIINTAGSSSAVTMAYGATSGLFFAWNAAVVAANLYLDWYGEIRLDGGVTKLYGGASAITNWFNFDDAEIGFI
jgi:hypothetical protein